MAGAGEELSDHPLPPTPPLDQQQPMEEAAAQLRRLNLRHGDGDGGDDELSFRMEDLPEEIQHVVMSLLPLKEAVRTSIVARCWRMLWSFHSNLCFYGPNGLDLHSGEFDGSDEQAFDDFIKIKRGKLIVKEDKFIEDVNWVIQRHSGIGISKFSIICSMHKDSDHLDRWVAFAASAKAKVIEFDLTSIFWPYEEVHHFPLEALGVQGSSFVQSLCLAHVSIKPHSGIRGFTILQRLVLKCVEIFGYFPGLLANCSALEDLEIVKCSGVTNLSIPHELDKLQHLVIARTFVEMVEFHAAHFEYEGRDIPIVLHGCSKLEKATMRFRGGEGLGRVFTAVPSILPVKILHVDAVTREYEQLLKLTTRSHRVFTHLRHLTCNLLVVFGSSEPMNGNGVLQLAYCLNVAPQLETLHLDDSMSDEVVEEEEGSPAMCRHDHLKTVYMTGFVLYKAQIKLACCILENAPLLEHMQVEVEARRADGKIASFEKKFVPQVREWARLTSLRFGKVVTAVEAHSE